LSEPLAGGILIDPKKTTKWADSRRNGTSLDAVSMARAILSGWGLPSGRPRLNWAAR
jgi:hypothetical protein